MIENSVSQYRRPIVLSACIWALVWPLQIVVTYANPAPEIWDLRKSMAPKLKLEGGHASGVLSGMLSITYLGRCESIATDGSTSCMFLFPMRAERLEPRVSMKCISSGNIQYAEHIMILSTR